MKEKQTRSPGKLKNLLALAWTFFKIGLLTFGGGYAMIPIIQAEVAEKHKWISEEELMHIVTIAESTPGPIAINLATFVGYKRSGFLGSLLATLGVVLPSLVILYVISLFLDVFLENRYVAYAFTGIKCAVAFLILKAGMDMLAKLPKKPVSLVVFAVVFVAMIVFEMCSVSFSTIIFILAGGVLGVFLYSTGKGKVMKK